MEDGREARRKRLTEHKADRLAFIRGQNRTLAQSAQQDAASDVEDITAIQSPIYRHSEDITGNALHNSNKQERASKPDTTRLHKLEVESENPQIAANYVWKEQKIEKAFNEYNTATSGENESGQLSASSMPKNPVVYAVPSATNTAQNVIFTIFTLINISHSVLATKNIRLIFSFVVAILVVSSYNGFMVGGRLVSSNVSFRPLFLVLFTDVTIIFGWVFFNQGISLNPEKAARKAMQEDNGWSNDLSKILKIGQVLHKVLGAAFMDCSICAIIMICGFVV